MEKWEYLTTFVEANARTKETKEFIKQRFDVKKPARYAPEAMIPELNKLGEEGWELLHMEPVAAVGGKGDVRFDNGYWSNTYFCVFKRRKPGAIPQVMPVNAAGQPAFPVQPPAPPQQPPAAPPPMPGADPSQTS